MRNVTEAVIKCNFNRINIMLGRDQYQPDPCIQHFPDASFENFQTYMGGMSAFRRMFMDNAEFEK